jgi:hypothetical protein
VEVIEVEVIEVEVIEAEVINSVRGKTSLRGETVQGLLRPGDYCIRSLWSNRTACQSPRFFFVFSLMGEAVNLWG